MENQLNDQSLMPFGKYKGRQMQDVPAEYLIWLYEENKCTPPVKDYIKDNLEVLHKEVASKE